MDGHRSTVHSLRPFTYGRRGAALWRRTCIALLLAAGMLASFTTAAIPAPPSPVSRLAAGMFLVAQEQIRDPRFQRTVILITAHNVHGTMGLIINRPTSLPLHEALPHVQVLHDHDEPLFIGGPVGQHSLFALIRSHTPPQDGLQIMAGTYFVEGLSGLKAVLAAHDPETAMRAFVGYTGWEAGQLKAEIDRGDWLVVGADSSAIFDKDPASVWSELMRRFGGKWI